MNEELASYQKLPWLTAANQGGCCADSCLWGKWRIATLSKLPKLAAANQRWLLLLIAAPGVNGELSR
jgi:hypothetical protein